MRIQFFLLALLSFSLAAQTLIEGRVYNVESGESLPAANIQIAGTYKGTISNEQGEYQLQISQFPATLLVNYIGYATTEIGVQSPGRLDIALQPVTYQLDEIIVTGEDPAVNIMRKVIARKKEWRGKLNTYSARAYTRQVLSNDSGIVSITESISDAYWDRKRGSREVIKSKRQTENVEESNNFAGASYVANFYDDDIELQGFEMIGPTHPDAIKHYHFKLTGRRKLGDATVYDISVNPKGKLQPTFIGKIAVLDEAYAMIEVDLKPSESILFPPPIQKFDLFYKQQFSNFGRDFWLPVDVRINGNIKFGIVGLDFPAIIYQQVSQLTDYDVNVALPDSLYEDERQLISDSLAIAEQNLLANSPLVIPLTSEENSAYSEIDSSETFEKAFKPSGFLARFVDIEDDGSGGRDSTESFFSRYFSPSPQLWYNRVDGGHFGLNLEIPLNDHLQLGGNAGYRSEQNNWAFGGKITLREPGIDNLTLEGQFQDGTAPRFRSPSYNMTINSVLPLLGRDDYFDYYHNRSVGLQSTYRIRPLNIEMTGGLNIEKHRSLEKETDYQLFDRSFVQRENPPVADGRLRSVSAAVQWGDDYIPWGAVGQNRFKVSVEHSTPDFLDSDFSFTRYEFSADFRLPTFLRRRWLPNALDVHVTAGTSDGDLPAQRFGTLDGNLGIFSPFGGFRSLNYHPYEGEKWLGIFAEHNFRTVPFEILGLRGLARRGVTFLAHGSIGRTWISGQTLNSLSYSPFYQDQYHQEAGVSISNIFGLMRFDLTRRLDRPDWHFGLSFARFF